VGDDHWDEWGLTNPRWMIGKLCVSLTWEGDATASMENTRATTLLSLQVDDRGTTLVAHRDRTQEEE